MLSSGRSRLIGVVAVVLVIAIGFGVWWVFFRDDAPDEVSSEDASRTAEEAAGTDDGSTDGDLNGTWTVDTEIGSDDDDTSTFVGYRMDEELAGIGANTAVGRTHGVTGSITVDGDEVTETSFEVDMTTLESDEDRRDNALRDRGLQTNDFPTATFTLTEPFAIPADAATDGATVTFDAVGDLDLHGVIQQVTLPIEATLNGEIASLVGSLPIALADYDIEPPTVPGRVLSVEDNGELEFQIFLTKG